MAYGNLPGGGYSGFVKAEKPLLIAKRKYDPVKEEWPPKHGVYGEKLPEAKDLSQKDVEASRAEKEQLLDLEDKEKRLPPKSLLKRREAKKADLQPGLETDNYKDIASEPDKVPRKIEKYPDKKPKKAKKVTFDDKHLEDYSEIPTEQEIEAEETGRLTSEEGKREEVERQKVRQGKVTGDHRYREDDSKIAERETMIRERKEKKADYEYPEEDSKITAKEKFEAKGLRDKVTSDDKRLEDYSEISTGKKIDAEKTGRLLSKEDGKGGEVERQKVRQGKMTDERRHREDDSKSAESETMIKERKEKKADDEYIEEDSKIKKKTRIKEREVSTDKIPADKKYPEADSKITAKEKLEAQRLRDKVTFDDKRLEDYYEIPTEKEIEAEKAGRLLSKEDGKREAERQKVRQGKMTVERRHREDDSKKAESETMIKERKDKKTIDDKYIEEDSKIKKKIAIKERKVREDKKYPEEDSKITTKEKFKAKELREKVTFDDKNLEDYSEIPTKQEVEHEEIARRLSKEDEKRGEVERQKVRQGKVTNDRRHPEDDSKKAESETMIKERKEKKKADDEYTEELKIKKKTKTKKRKVRDDKIAADKRYPKEDSKITKKTKLEAKEFRERVSKDDTYIKGDSKTTIKEKIEPMKGRREKQTTEDKYPTDSSKRIEGETKRPHSKRLPSYAKGVEGSRKTFAEKVKDVTKVDIEDGTRDTEKQDIDKVSDEFVKPAAEKEVPLRVKFRRTRGVPTYTYCKRKRSILRFSPCLERLLHSRRVQHRGLKAMLGFPIGAMFGFALYWFVLERMGAHHNFCWLLGTCVGIGFALSTQVRCICLLSIPACCGRAGRAFVSTYIVAYVIEGPLSNILANSKEAMRSISCTASLNLNHSVERFRLMYKPIKDIVMDFVGAGDKVQKDTKQLEKTFSEVENEVRDENEVRESMADVEQLDDEIGGESRSDVIKKKFRKGKRKLGFGENSEKKYGMKSEFRCEGIFTKGVRACYDSFGKAYDRCHSYLPIIGYLLCWPMKLTFICDLASSMMGKRSCDSDTVVNPGFGASVDTADAVQSELDKDFAVQLQYKLIIPEESVDQLVPEDISGAMKYSFERRKRNLDFFTQLVDRILALLFLLVLNSSRNYCNQYLRTIQFDNKYVTPYFRHIDARRRKKGKMVLLSLKKGEKIELSDPFSVKFAVEEKALMIVKGLRLISEVFTVIILLMFDRIFYELLDVIKRHAHVTYKQTGVHHIKMTIYGDGFVGNMVRGILKGFDKKHSADQVTTTEACLPLPTKLPNEAITRLCLVFGVMLVLIIVESYALRLRRVICAFFYPKREKRRILFLYNDRLKKRRSFLQHLRHRVRKQAREQTIAMDSGVFFSLRLFYPKYFNWVSKLGLGLARCLICNEIESRKCHLVNCSECPFSYCSECWQDTEGICYACIPDYDTEPSENSSDED